MLLESVVWHPIGFKVGAQLWCFYGNVLLMPMLLSLEQSLLPVLRKGSSSPVQSHLLSQGYSFKSCLVQDSIGWLIPNVAPMSHLTQALCASREEERGARREGAEVEVSQRALCGPAGLGCRCFSSHSCFRQWGGFAGIPGAGCFYFSQTLAWAVKPLPLSWKLGPDEWSADYFWLNTITVCELKFSTLGGGSAGGVWRGVLVHALWVVPGASFITNGIAVYRITMQIFKP